MPHVQMATAPACCHRHAAAAAATSKPPPPPPPPGRHWCASCPESRPVCHLKLHSLPADSVFLACLNLPAPHSMHPFSPFPAPGHDDAVALILAGVDFSMLQWPLLFSDLATAAATVLLPPRCRRYCQCLPSLPAACPALSSQRPSAFHSLALHCLPAGHSPALYLLGVSTVAGNQTVEKVPQHTALQPLRLRLHAALG